MLDAKNFLVMMCDDQTLPTVSIFILSAQIWIQDETGVNVPQVLLW